MESEWILKAMKERSSAQMNTECYSTNNASSCNAGEFFFFEIWIWTTAEDW